MGIPCLHSWGTALSSISYRSCNFAIKAVLGLSPSLRAFSHAAESWTFWRSNTSWLCPSRFQDSKNSQPLLQVCHRIGAQLTKDILMVTLERSGGIERVDHWYHHGSVGSFCHSWAVCPTPGQPNDWRHSRPTSYLFLWRDPVQYSWPPS